MRTLDDFKQTWNEKQNSASDKGDYSQETLGKIVRSRMRSHMNDSFRYFWASFVLQIIVYAMLSHVLVKYWGREEIILLSVTGILLYIPFTFVLVHKFKRMARLMSVHGNNQTLYDSILRQKTLLTGFYRFKKIYEIFLIPLSSAIGVLVIFELYIPGTISENLTAAVIVFLVTLASCFAAIISENNKSFKKPIGHLEELLDQYKNEF